MDAKRHIMLLEHKLEREHASRIMAEKLLEIKSRELFTTNSILETSLKKLQLQAELNSEQLTYQTKIENLLLTYARLFLKQPPSRSNIQQLIDSLVDGVYISACYISIMPIENITISGEYCSGRQQTWQPPADLPNKLSLWDSSTNLYWIALINSRGIVGYFAAKISSPKKSINVIQQRLALFCELFRSAIGRQITLSQAIHARQRAEDSEQSTRDFLAMINHELRTPLNGLLGSAELLQDTPLNPNQTKLLTTLNHSGELLRAIINDLLDYSKINAGMLELIEKPFDSHLLVIKLRDIFSHCALEKRLDFNIEYSADIPRSIRADEDRLKQIYVNLIANAIKFTQQGFVHAKFSWENNCLLFTIKDSGCGIEQQQQHKLFKPFSQIDISSKRSHEGTGLGLAICKQLCEQMNGKISLVSEQNIGTTFSVSLPLTISTIDETLSTHPPASHEALQKLKILVVEDLKTNQMIIQLMLQKHKIDVTIVDNGQAALDIIAEQPFDIVFMDCRMPIMDGYCATKALRKQKFTKPIIALTAGTTSAEREACINAGMDDILCKPYMASELLAMLNSWCNAS
ncbi:ATPase [Photobacterium kishitanii]|uniref:histidine kinase n=1 Tax=Photobacterium kishitanii TaxID=318456 RepID=A0AAX0Z1R2_9GAMM|nr:ATP-binding protein [Photobacterium kishitanii]KJG59861.1 ATPase [Photobacterium kishitanii]KJG63144.1 ATPase [Photobacterium kishitanii]KJG67845.1 ATPase [Photobacterium kishitanii]KJG71316.1 ATPase [Photobacterium kishitanii]OBU30824.1 hybrid sensor histidine kinase/response regulator [Photobacterium kishitanii]